MSHESKVTRLIVGLAALIVKPGAESSVLVLKECVDRLAAENAALLNDLKQIREVYRHESNVREAEASRAKSEAYEAKRRATNQYEYWKTRNEPAASANGAKS